MQYFVGLVILEMVKNVSGFPLGKFPIWIQRIDASKHVFLVVGLGLLSGSDPIDVEEELYGKLLKGCGDLGVGIGHSHSVMASVAYLQYATLAQDLCSPYLVGRVDAKIGQTFGIFVRWNLWDFFFVVEFDNGRLHFPHLRGQLQANALPILDLLKITLDLGRLFRSEVHHFLCERIGQVRRVVDILHEFLLTDYPRSL